MLMSSLLTRTQSFRILRYTLPWRSKQGMDFFFMLCEITVACMPAYLHGCLPAWLCLLSVWYWYLYTCDGVRLWSSWLPAWYWVQLWCAHCDLASPPFCLLSIGFVYPPHYVAKPPVLRLGRVYFCFRVGMHQVDFEEL